MEAVVGQEKASNGLAGLWSRTGQDSRATRHSLPVHAHSVTRSACVCVHACMCARELPIVERGRRPLIREDAGTLVGFMFITLGSLPLCGPWAVARGQAQESRWVTLHGRDTLLELNTHTPTFLFMGSCALKSVCHPGAPHPWSLPHRNPAMGGGHTHPSRNGLSNQHISFMPCFQGQ